ncbi:hypothetical protein [Microbacterium tumbae]
MNENRTGSILPLRIVAAVLLAATGIIHLYLVLTGTGGLLGTLFVLNGVAGVVLAVALVWLRGGLLRLAAVLSVLFLVASIVALLLSLTVGLFGITETWSNPFVVASLVVEALGVVATALCVARLQPGAASR